MATKALVPRRPSVPKTIRPDQAESLVALFNLYMQVEAAAGAENTAEAKRRDLNGFLDFFTQAVGSDHPDHWTRSMTTGYRRRKTTAATHTATTHAMAFGNK